MDNSGPDPYNSYDRRNEAFMRLTIQSVADLGLAVRAVRRHSHVRIDDLAGTAGVSKQFTQDVEHGKPTVQLGRVLRLLAELGLPLELDIPDEAAHALETLRIDVGARATTAPALSKRRP
jgi:transcriptional regulator with XRE-family HTH domain